MGRYLSTNLCSASVIKTDCKVRYLLSLLRKHLPLGGAPVCMELWRNSLHSPPHPSRFTRNPYFRRLNHSYITTTSYLLGDFTKEEKHLQSVRFYSCPKRNTFKAEAPIGIFEEAQTRFNLSSLGGHLGRSFNRLSSHSPASAYVGTSQRRNQSQHSANERELSESKEGIAPETVFNKKVLFDGLCPVCTAEIRFLQFLQKNQPEKIDFVDISLPDYDGAKHKDISYEVAMEEMHVIDEKDEVHRGIPAFAVMYGAVGLGWLGRFMMWSPVRPFMDMSYAVFARNRLKWTGRGGECNNGRCDRKKQ